MTRPSALLAACLMALPLLASCSGGSEEEAAPEPAEVLAEAKQRLDETPGVRLGLRTDALPEGVDGILTASGVSTHDAFEGDLDVMLNGFTVNVPVIAVDGLVFAVLPFAEDYEDIDPEEYGAPDPAGLLDSESGISAWLTDAQEVTEGEPVRDGKAVLTPYSGTLSGKAVAKVIPSADKAADFPVTFNVDDEGTLTSVEVVGPFYGDGGDVDYTVTLSDYGTDKDIERP